MKRQLALFASLWAFNTLAGANPVETCSRLMGEHAVQVADTQNSEPITESNTTAEDQAALEYIDAGAWHSIYDPCPEQVDELLQHPWAKLLARPPEELFLGDLAGLPALEQSYILREPGSLIDLDTLDALLAELQQQPQPPPSLWQRLMEWLAQWLSDTDPKAPRWLDDISVPEMLVTSILFGSLALIVLLAAFIVFRELRQGLAHRRKVEAVGWDIAAGPAIGQLAFSDLANAPLSEQPGLLLRIILARLQNAGLMPHRSSLTHRDIAAASATIERGAAVGLISRAAERATYGNWQPAPEDIDPLLQTGREFCAALDDTHAGQNANE